jgi:phytoene/squalene synthetase
MGAIYFALLKNIERADYDVFSRRVTVSRPARAAIAVGTWVRILLVAIRAAWR